jgi:hypothetical protein
MIIHVVLFRPRHDLPTEERTAVAVAFQDALAKIPSVVRATIGSRLDHDAPYEHPLAKAYPYAAILEFADLDGLHAYLQHTAHAAPAQQFFAAVEAALIIDYDTEDATGNWSRVLGLPAT